MSVEAYAVSPPIYVGAEGGTGFKDGKLGAHYVVDRRSYRTHCQSSLADELKSLAYSVTRAETLEIIYGVSPICPECDQRKSTAGIWDSIAENSLALLVLNESPDLGSQATASTAVIAIKEAMKKLKDGGRLVLATRDEEFRFTTIRRAAEIYLGLNVKIMELPGRAAVALMIEKR